MRGLVLLFGVLLGLAAAVLVFGRIDHLRMVAADRLPAWTDTLASGSGLGSGRIGVSELPPLTKSAMLTWAWSGFAGGTPKWDVVLDDVGAKATAVLELSLGQRLVLLREGQGRLSLSDLTGNLPIPAVDGDVRIDMAQADFRPSDRRLTRLEAAGQVLGVTLDGQPVGNGPFSLTADVGGGWRLEFQLVSDAVQVQGRLAGRIGGRKLSLDALITPGADMPKAWSAQLNFLTKPDDQGRWPLRAAFPI